jgi:hypothetical protein
MNVSMDLILRRGFMVANKKRHAVIVRNHPNERCITARDEDGRMFFFIRGAQNYPGNLVEGTKGTIQYVPDRHTYGLGQNFFTPLPLLTRRWKSMSKLEEAYRQGKLAF